MADTALKDKIIQGLSKWGKWILIAILVMAGFYWLRIRPIPVEGYQVAQGEIVAEVMGTGTLEAKVQTIVSTKIAGRILDMRVDQGDQVRVGQTLLRLDDSEFRQQVEIARSALDAAKATVERMQADAVRSQAVLEQSRIEYRRRESLFASKSIAANEIDKRKEELKVAEADLEKTKAAIVESRKNLVVAQNTVDYQLARLGDTLIAAPFDGLIIRRDRDPGDVVVPGTSIFLLISTQSLWVRTWVDETEMQRVTEGQKARVVFRAEPEASYIGKVARLGRETDRETREFLVDVEIERLPRNWSVGQRADVFIETAHKVGVTIIPSRLIMRNQGEIGVVANREGRAVWQPVKTGLRGHAQVEIVAGLSPGDIVVYNQGPDLVPEGRRLEISNREPGR
jgi:RND family efflux transporter MFP subunit